MARSERELWVDNLRVTVIAVVIVLHAATAYVVDVAGWYYEDERDASGVLSSLLTVPVLLGALFGLGPLFLVAGWFSARSLAHRGPGAFLRSRLLRLGLPTVVFVLLVQPFTDWLGNLRDERGSFVFYLRQTEVSVMWFAVALLAFSLGYGLLRRVRPARRPHGRPGAGVVAVAAGAIAVSSFAVWQVWPLTEEMFLNLRVAEWPQGAVLFALGVRAGEAGWAAAPPTLHQVRWLGWAALGGAAAFVSLLAVGVAAGRTDLGPSLAWPTMVTAALDGLVAVTATVWLVVWFRGRWTDHGALVGSAARASFATYFVHPTVLTAIMLACATVPLGAWPKLVLVAAVAVPASFAAGYGLTRLPGVSRVL